MSYTDFDVPRVEKDLHLEVVVQKIDWQLEPITPSDWLLKSLEKGGKNAFVSERFYLSEVEKILGVFKSIFDFYEG